jgi:hypothetical protein
MIDAVEVDTESSIGWKEDITAHLHAAMRLFLEHDTKGGAGHERG